MIEIPCREPGCARTSESRNTTDDDGVVRGWCAEHVPENINEVSPLDPVPDDE